MELDYETRIVELWPWLCNYVVDYSLSYVDNKLKLVPRVDFTLTSIYSRFFNAKLDEIFCVH